MSGLEEILKINNVSITDLAKELDIARGNVYNWINGKRNIPKATLKYLSKRFGVPEEFFKKELTEVEKVETEKAMIENLIQKNSFEYTDTTEGEEGEIQTTSEFIDHSLIQYKDELEVELEKKKLNAQVIDRVNSTLMNTNDVRKIADIFNSINNIVNGYKVPLSVLDNVLQAILVAYDMSQQSQESDFVSKLVDVIKGEERHRQQKEEEIRRMIKEAGLEDMFK